MCLRLLGSALAEENLSLDGVHAVFGQPCNSAPDILTSIDSSYQQPSRTRSFNDMSKPCGINSQASPNYTAHIMPTVSCMEIDSPTASPDIGEEPASNGKGRHELPPYGIESERWSSATGAPHLSLHIAGSETIGQSEGALIVRY